MPTMQNHLKQPGTLESTADDWALALGGSQTITTSGNYIIPLDFINDIPNTMTTIDYPSTRDLQKLDLWIAV